MSRHAAHRRRPVPDRRRRGRWLRLAPMAATALLAAWPSPAAAQSGGWELEAINAPAAHTISTGEGVVVAVVDTGVGEHPDLAGRVVDGWAAEGMTTEREDLDGHGTAVAGKVAQAAPDARIMPIRTGTTVGGLGVGADGPMAEGITWAVDHGAQVVVVSQVISDGTEPLRDAVAYALDNDVLVVAGAGNDPAIPIWWPAAFPGVVAVTGTDPQNASWESSTTGPESVLAAPADVMPALVPQETGVFADENQPLYQDLTGTSLATPLVGGVAALVMAEHPDLDAANVINRLISAAHDLGDPGRDDVFGYGLVDAEAALTADVDPVDASPLGSPGGGAATEEADPEADAKAEAGDSGSTESSSSDGDVQAADDSDDSGPPTASIGAVVVGAAVVATVATLVVRRRASRTH